MARKCDGGDERRQLLTVDQLAKRWQVSERTIHRRIKDRKIKVIRIGRAIRIHPTVAEIGPEGEV